MNLSVLKLTKNNPPICVLKMSFQMFRIASFVIGRALFRYLSSSDLHAKNSALNIHMNALWSLHSAILKFEFDIPFVYCFVNLEMSNESCGVLLLSYLISFYNCTVSKRLKFNSLSFKCLFYEGAINSYKQIVSINNEHWFKKKSARLEKNLWIDVCLVRFDEFRQQIVNTLNNSHGNHPKTKKSHIFCVVLVGAKIKKTTSHNAFWTFESTN